MPAKIARSAPRPPFGLPELTVAVRTSLLSCRKAGKTRVFTPVRESSGESRLNLTQPAATNRIGCRLGEKMKRSMIAAIMLLGTGLTAHALETDVWDDIRKPWRSDAEMPSAVKADAKACEREVGVQRGPLTTKFKECMLRHDWTFSHIKPQPAPRTVVHRYNNNSGGEIFVRQLERRRGPQPARPGQHPADDQQPADVRQSTENERRAGQPKPAADDQCAVAGVRPPASA